MGFEDNAIAKALSQRLFCAENINNTQFFQGCVLNSQTLVCYELVLKRQIITSLGDFSQCKAVSH